MNFTKATETDEEFGLQSKLNEVKNLLKHETYRARLSISILRIGLKNCTEYLPLTFDNTYTASTEIFTKVKTLSLNL